MLYLESFKWAKLYLVLVFIAQSFLTYGQDELKTQLKYGGFVKLDLMFTAFEGGELSNDSPGKDIHLPSTIPIGGENSFDTHAHVKESRFNFDITHELLGKKVHGFMELDFLLSAAGDQRVSNSYNPRVRHFFFEYGRWTFGQTWTTFMTVVLPDDLDFTGAAEGIVFARQPLIRYAINDWQFAIENPETTITPNGGGPFEISSGGIPDFIVKKTFDGRLVSGGISVIARNPRYYDDQQVRRGIFGYGLASGMNINVGKRNDLRAQIAYGSGLGRYAGLGFLNSSVIKDDGNLASIDAVNAFIAYTHHWNQQWRSSVNYSFLEAQNPARYTGAAANQSAFSASGNVIYSPVPRLMFGGEVMYAYRALESGAGNDMIRIQFSARYSFGYWLEAQSQLK